MRQRYYTTKSTVPESVRLEVWKAWEALRRRLRRRHPLIAERMSELRNGTPLRVGGVEYKLQYSGPWGELGTAWGFYISLYSGPSFFFPGTCDSSGTPYTYADELQSAIDSLIVDGVMQS